MHAVVDVSISDPEQARRDLRERLVSGVSQATGFVSGYCIQRDGGDKGHAVVVIERQEAARAAAERVRSMTPATVTVDDVSRRGGRRPRITPGTRRARLQPAWLG